jgi:thymidylate synthase (FAD)
MSAKLVWATEDAEVNIVYMTRVSNPKNQHNKEYKGLLKYCIRNRHWSILELANMCIEIKCETAIAQQILRHRSFSATMFSQRYASVDNDLDVPQFRSQDKKNRQNSIDNVDDTIKNNLTNEWIEHNLKTKNLYRKMLDAGIAKETARFILPQNAPTRLYLNGTARSFYHYLEVRLDKSTQAEHRAVSLEIQKIFNKVFPTIGEILQETLDKQV